MTTTTTTTLYNATLAAEYARLAEAKERIETRMEAIKATLRVLGPGSHQAGDYTVSVSPNRRLDVAALSAAYPAAEHPPLYATTLDVKAARKHLPPAVVDGFMVEQGEPKVSVR